jgi:hypothetical protein
MGRHHRHGHFLQALSRASRFQACGSCGHTWYARGHTHSPRCPNCGAVRPARSSSGGCLPVVGAALAIGFGVIVLVSMVGVARDRAGTGGIIGVLVGLESPSSAESC